MHPLKLRSPLGKQPAIVEYRVRQTRDGVDVDVVARADFDAAAIRAAIEARLAGLGLRAPAVAIRRVDRIERQATGKLTRFAPLPG